MYSSNELLWSSEVFSEGSTNNIEKIGKPLIKGAMEEFPKSGSWEKTLKIDSSLRNEYNMKNSSNNSKPNPADTGWNNDN